MGFLDRFNRTNRTGRFEERHYLSTDDKDKINEEVKKVYHNIMQGYMTRAQGKEHILKYITLLLKTKYPGIDFEKTGLAGKINRYASMKIRKLDEGDIGLGEAKREGESNKIRNDLKREADKFIGYRAKNRLGGPSEDELRLFLDNYARSKGYSARGFIEEVVSGYHITGTVSPIAASGKEFEKYKYGSEKIPRSNVNIEKMLRKEERDKIKETATRGLVEDVMEKRGTADAWIGANEKRKKEMAKEIIEEMQILWDS
jgi:hypothetical protein